MSLPSLRRRLILTLSGAGLLLLVIIVDNAVTCSSVNSSMSSYN